MDTAITRVIVISFVTVFGYQIFLYEHINVSVIIMSSVIVVGNEYENVGNEFTKLAAMR